MRHSPTTLLAWTLLLTPGCAAKTTSDDSTASADAGSDSSAPTDGGGTNGTGQADSGDTDPGDSAAHDDSGTAPNDSGTAPNDSGTAPDDSCASTCDCARDSLCYDGTCRIAGPALAIYRERINEAVAAMDPATGGFEAEGAYPTEALMSFASAAEVLCDADAETAAQVRATFALSWENGDHLIIYSPAPYISRDYQARHIYNLWAAGQALGDRALLDAADAAAQSMMSLERQEYGDYTLFCTTYGTTTPYDCQIAPWIDVNQNSEVGMAFALLASDPTSALYLDPTAIDIADQELAAAASVQASDGAIPIAESGGYEDDYDTLYGSYAAFSWAIAAAARPLDLALQGHLLLAAAWLLPYSDATPESHRTYPSVYDGDISMSEGAMRTPVLAAAGVLDPKFVEAWWAIVASNDETYSSFLPLHLMLLGGASLEAIIPPAE
jgi:hypothetical protein